MKRIVVLLAVWLVAGAFALSGAPLDVVKIGKLAAGELPGSGIQNRKRYIFCQTG